VEPAALSVIPVTGLPEIEAGADLAGLIVGATELRDRDVVVVTQKVVSKAEGRIVEVDPFDEGAKRQLAEAEAVRVLRRRGDLVVTETRQGYVCANSGIDLSNMKAGTAALLPEDPDRSARRIRDGIRGRAGVEVGVVVSDTFGRAWRRGVVDVAIGIAGLRGIVDLRGSKDALGRELVATEMCIVDEVAAAAELVMGKAFSVPVAVVRGLQESAFGEGSVQREVVRPYQEDLFR
jgi:coenzyme F420-0:L-glutamate ligase/coenzyme F420-1:gamma-L-glutamate ligase